MKFAGFDWDDGNREKCKKHGVALSEIEAMFGGTVAIKPDLDHSHGETRLFGIGRGSDGRHIFVAFTIRTRDGKNHLRPISARYMHSKEVEHYEQANS